MKLFWIFAVIINSAYANYQYFHFDAKEALVNTQSYNRYILPQLKSLLKEYYYILEKVDPLQKEIVNIKSRTLDMRKTWERVRTSCTEISPECTVGIQEIYQFSRELDKDLSNYLAEKIAIPKENIKVDSTLKLHSSFDKLFNLNYQNLHNLEEYLLTSGTPLYPFHKIHKNLGANLHQMSLTCEMAMTGKFHPDIQEEFDFAWSNFFKIVENHLLENKGQEYFISRLGELNMSWNSFSMRMTKGNLKVSKEVSNLVKLMHNRWNSILKIILRRN